MSRTKHRRPLPSNRLSPERALVFSLCTGVVGVAMFAVMFNWLSALMALGTLLFYSLAYTLWLKPNTPQNIVIGGAAGAMAPVGAWAAATGEMALLPWLLFLLVFLWTPPHFWALALFCRDDYVKARLPMMPVVKGTRSTLNQMTLYSILLVFASLTLVVTGAGWIYLFVALVMGTILVRKCISARADATEARFKALFGYSITYLFVLFLTLVVDSFVAHPLLS